MKEEITCTQVPTSTWEMHSIATSLYLSVGYVLNWIDFSLGLSSVLQFRGTKKF